LHFGTKGFPSTLAPGAKGFYDKRFR
jgi:hypothetical protein